MKEIVNKLKAIEKETSAERGDYNIFALFLREDSFNKWDIIVSANWFENNREKALKYLAPKVQKALTQDELLQISRIVIIDDNNPELPALQQAVNIEHGLTEYKNFDLFGLQIKHAYLITSKRREAA